MIKLPSSASSCLFLVLITLQLKPQHYHSACAGARRGDTAKGEEEEEEQTDLGRLTFSARPGRRGGVSFAPCMTGPGMGPCHMN